MKTIAFLLLFSFLPPALREISTTVDTDYETISVPLGGGCSLSCAMGWKLTATSTLKNNGQITYLAENMNDGLPETAWAEGATGYGIGEKFIATMDGDSSMKNIPFRGLRIANGYQKNNKTWKDNSRIKKLKVYHNGKAVFIINLQDKMGVQLATWEDKPLLLTFNDVITFEIMDVYKGDKYDDTVISDLSFDGAH
jgi:hypothetical protein